MISASFKGSRLLRLRRACSAAIEDLPHFFPAATILATSGPIPDAAPAPAATTGATGGAAAAAGGAAGAAAGVAAVAGGADGAAPAGAPPAAVRSHAIGSPVFRLAISSSVSNGRFERLRYACSAAITEADSSAALGNAPEAVPGRHSLPSDTGLLPSRSLTSPHPACRASVLDC